jgi:hypothetical protein
VTRTTLNIQLVEIRQRCHEATPTKSEDPLRPEYAEDPRQTRSISHVIWRRENVGCSGATNSSLSFC